mmetsp:Transcript_17212/g.28989  ORF Transcript_17212/g.28989 Transcript_17212/m.28989 type:complete len:123 (+) Transcript_17212:245-613(+)
MLNIVCLKFNVQESKLDNRVKKEYFDLFNNMLTNFSSIITDQFNIQFHETQSYNLALPPTVYELLWRYEYITFKHQINETLDVPSMRQSLSSKDKMESELGGNNSPLKFEMEKRGSMIQPVN